MSAVTMALVDDLNAKCLYRESNMSVHVLNNVFYMSAHVLYRGS